VSSHPKYRIDPILSYVLSQHIEFVVHLVANKYSQACNLSSFISMTRSPTARAGNMSPCFSSLKAMKIPLASKKATPFHRGEFTGRIAEIVKEPDYS
jgi:hypothetical protein